MQLPTRLTGTTRSSVFARVALLVYVLLITYASWFPFSGWHVSGLPPWGFISAPLPHYWTWFDFMTNVIAYVPIGILGVFALYPILRNWAAMLVTLIGGVAVSATMEALQTYLPSRVSSNLDLLTNMVGVGIGTLVAPAMTRFFLEDSQFLQLRKRWFTHEASRGFLVLGLWPLAQIYPQAYLFGHGQLLPIVSNWLGKALSTPLDLGALLRDSPDLSAEQYWLYEAIITACGLIGTLLTLSCVLRSRAPRTALLGVLLMAALAMKSLVNALLYGPDNAFAWLTPGAKGGLILGLIMLTGLVSGPRVAQRRVAVFMLTTCLLVLNLAPANPYFVATLQSLTQGKFLNFNGAAQFLSLLWPYLALWFLLHRTHRNTTI